MARASASDNSGGWLGSWFSSTKSTETTTAPESESKEPPKPNTRTVR